jgi:hypothetical protein
MSVGVVHSHTHRLASAETSEHPDHQCLETQHRASLANEEHRAAAGKFKALPENPMMVPGGIEVRPLSNPY